MQWQEHVKKVYPFIEKAGSCSKCGKAGELHEHMSGIRLCGACEWNDNQERVVFREQMEAQDRARLRAREHADIERQLQVIPAHYEQMAFARQDITTFVRRREAIEEARAAVGAAMTVLVGAAGAGKTVLAAAMVREAADQALNEGEERAVRCALVRQVSWVSAPDLARARARHRLGDGEAPMVTRALEATLLVIDDLGMEPLDRDGAVSEVIYARHAAERPTIITTACSAAVLLERYGDGIARRLTEAGHARLIRCAEQASSGARPR